MYLVVINQAPSCTPPEESPRDKTRRGDPSRRRRASPPRPPCYPARDDLRMAILSTDKKHKTHFPSHYVALFYFPTLSLFSLVLLLLLTRRRGRATRLAGLCLCVVEPAACPLWVIGTRDGRCDKADETFNVTPSNTTKSSGCRDQETRLLLGILIEKKQGAEAEGQISSGQ